MTNEELQARCAQLVEQNAILTQQVEWLKRQLFGRKSERFEHPELFEDDEGKKPGTSPADDPAAEADSDGSQGGDTASDPPRKRRPIRAARLPDNLPVVTEEQIPPCVQAEPGRWKRIGAESHRQLEKEPGYFYLREIIRPKYVAVGEPQLPPVISPAQPTMIENGFLGGSLLAEILCNRFLYHLPYYRQEQLYIQRYGIALDRNTMSDAASKVARQCEILCRRMREVMIENEVIQVDETSVRYLDPSVVKGSSLGYLWVYRGLNNDILFDWQTSREHRHLIEWLGEDIEGTIQSDGYEAYESLRRRQRRRGKRLSRAACMAHIRRKFVEAKEERPQTVGWILTIIQQLYETEEQLRKHKAPTEQRRRVRQNTSRPRIRLLERAIKHLLSKSIRPKSRLGLALRYALGQWPAMQTFLEDGRVEIDNNLVENGIRPSAVGKKNWLFMGSPEAGDRSAVLYSLLLSARAHGVDPQAYLRAVIEELPQRKSNDIDDLLPKNWAAENRALHPFHSATRHGDRSDSRAAA